MSSEKEWSAEDLEGVRRATILFGHQSVGQNLIGGLKVLGDEVPGARLDVAATEDPGRVAGPGFFAFRVGENGRPQSKIAAFSDYLSRLPSAPDVALFKFCYVDIGLSTNAEVLFREYREAMAALKARYPGTTFVHVTAPLTSLDGGVKRLVKKVLGKSTGEEANIARTRYNDLLRREYAEREPVFDLAAAESTAPDGERLRGQKNGAAYEALCPAYTDDGGHLNPLGSRVAAQALLACLVNVRGVATRTAR